MEGTESAAIKVYRPDGSLRIEAVVTASSAARAAKLAERLAEKAVWVEERAIASEDIEEPLPPIFCR